MYLFQQRYINFLSELRNLLSKIEYTSKPLKGKKIVFFPLRAYLGHEHLFECFLAYQLAELGADVFVVFDRGTLYWEMLQEPLKHVPIWASPHTDSIFFSKWHNLILKIIERTFKHSRVKFIYVDKVIKGKDLESLSYTDKLHVEASVRRYCMCGGSDIEDHRYSEIYKIALHNAKVVKTLSRELIDLINPDLFFSSHGIYSLYGPAYDYMRNSGVKTLIYGFNAHYPGKLILSKVPIQIISSEYNDKSTDSLSVDEKNSLEEYLTKRVSFRHKGSDLMTYFNPANIESPSFNTDRFKKRINIGIFPNVIWDGDVHIRNTIFDGTLDWIINTLTILNDLRNVNVFIRFHPAERLFDMNKSLESILRRKFAHLLRKEYVYLIPAESNLNSYDLIKEVIDLVLIYDGFLCIESVYLGKPVISCSKGAYNHKSFVYNFSDRRKYTRALLNPNEIINDFRKNYREIRERMFRYLRWLTNEISFDVPLLEDEYFCYSILLFKKNISESDINIYLNDKLRKILYYIIQEVTHQD
jgi:hypothetical protein